MFGHSRPNGDQEIQIIIMIIPSLRTYVKQSIFEIASSLHSSQ